MRSPMDLVSANMGRENGHVDPTLASDPAVLGASTMGLRS